jgi:hypothetical protein
VLMVLLQCLPHGNGIMLLPATLVRPVSIAYNFLELVSLLTLDDFNSDT